MMNTLKSFSVIIIMLITSTAFGQESKEQRLSNFIEKALEVFPVIPSVSIAVSNESGTIYNNCFGRYDIEKNLECDANTIFYIASTTKSFVGLLAVILADEGKIDLQEQITNYKPFKDFPNNDVFTNVTVSDLLTHQSGINNNFIPFLLSYSGNYTDASILKLVEEETARNKKGKAFNYSNFEYNLFSILLKEEFGLNWKDLLEEKIFESLSMKNTSAYISQVGFKAYPYNSFSIEDAKKIIFTKNRCNYALCWGVGNQC